jgi:hypothetical protein
MKEIPVPEVEWTNFHAAKTELLGFSCSSFLRLDRWNQSKAVSVHDEAISPTAGAGTDDE